MMEEPREIVVFPKSAGRSGHPRLSPDDHLLAFDSIESSALEVYVMDFPEFTSKTMVSRCPVEKRGKRKRVLDSGNG
jgi:Tol biopolymer transport system component